MTDTAAALQAVDVARRRDRIAGLAILVVAFLVGLGVSVWAKRASRPEAPIPPGPPSTAGVVGYPGAIDVVKSLGAARAHTRRPILRGIAAEGVKSDGTLDVGEAASRARYTFQSAEGQGAQPDRQPGTLPRRHYCGKQTVHLRKEGLVADPDITDFPCPPQHSDALPDPRCSFVDVWAHAIKKGAPRNRPARIEYYRSRVGPAWKFEIPASEHKFSLYGDCGRELDAAESTSIPP